jgi:hypothetical protein
MSASRAEGDAFTEEDLHLREAVVEGTLQGKVLHGVLYRRRTKMDSKKKKKKK